MANENIPRATIQRLRAAGHDVASIAEDEPGVADRVVLGRAQREGRILLTFDRDYGELVYRQKIPAPHGIVYLRLVPSTPEEPADVLLRLFELGDVPLACRFTVVEATQVRQRLLP